MRKNGCITIDDTEMYYVSFGMGKKNLVVIPGLSDGLTTVKGKALILSPPYRQFFRDYTVYMFSRKNRMAEGYSIRNMSNDLVRALKDLNIDQAYLLGVSQGGMIAQYMAIDYQEIVKNLIRAVTAPNANAIVKETITGWIGMAMREDHTALMVDTAEKMYSEKYLRKNRKYLPLLARLTKPQTYDRFLKNACAILKFDCRGELSKIGCPTLIIAGGDDRTVGNEAASELNRGITGSELYIYEDFGHGAFEEAKDFYDRVREFCER